MNKALIVVSLLSLLAVISHSAYEPSIALQMAYMSGVAYESLLSIEAWNCNLCSRYKLVLPKNFINLTSGVRGFTGYSASLGSIVVSFKGSDSVNAWIQNLKAFRDSYDKCKDCEVHRNFYAEYLTIRPAVINQIEALRKIYRNAKIFVTGHGLGGAFAILAASDIKDVYSVVDGVYTYGQPRIGNIQFASFFMKQIPETYRIINSGDIVPHLPFSGAGFFHSSYEIWYQNQMQSYKTCVGDEMGCSNSLPSSNLNIPDNNITNYLNLKVNSLSHLQQDWTIQQEHLIEINSPVLEEIRKQSESLFEMMRNPK